MAVEQRQRQFTVDEYHRMAEAAILAPDDRVELIDGAIITMSPLGSRHVACVIRLDRMLSRSIPDNLLVSVQNPVQLDTISEPQPDLALLRYRADFYADHLPTPEDVVLLIEVADSSLLYDRNVKLPLYARARIAETWIVDVIHRRVEVYSDPSGDRYQHAQVYDHADTIASPTVSGLVLPVSAIVD